MGKPKSRNMEDKPKFVNRLHNCPDTIRLFERLRDDAIRACNTNDWGYTDKPDFRIGCGYGLIELVLTPGFILVMIRVDDQWPSLEIPSMRTIQPVAANEQGKPGTQWIEWQVRRDGQIDESVSLMKAAYDKRKRTGWR